MARQSVTGERVFPDRARISIALNAAAELAVMTDLPKRASDLAQAIALALDDNITPVEEIRAVVDAQG